MSLGQPRRVVGPAEGEQGRAQLLDGAEGPHPQQVLLQGPDEALGAAVPFRCANERRGARDPEEAKFFLEVVGHVLASVVMPDGEAAGDARREAAEVAPHALADRLERREARRPGRGGGGGAGGGGG